MIRKKPYDGVVVAARYSLQGEIEWVRAFERHGFVFSDLVMMDRKTLVENLRDGKRYKTGERMTYWGNDFKINEDICLIESDGGSVIIAGGTSSNQDFLGSLPII